LKRDENQLDVNQGKTKPTKLRRIDAKLANCRPSSSKHRTPAGAACTSPAFEAL